MCASCILDDCETESDTGGQSRLGLREYKIDWKLIVAENKTVVYSTCLTEGAWSLVALNCQYDPSFLKGGEIEIDTDSQIEN